MTYQFGVQNKPFRLEEATIDELHHAIQTGQTTCVAVVQHYIDRARAYNGVSSMLVTEDGAPVPEAVGTVRAKAPLRFPTGTVKASEILPDVDKYQGTPLEFGRMEPTASDPAVQQQYGMIVGVPNAGQVNALATLNIRGERSVTCRGDFDQPAARGETVKSAAEHRAPDQVENHIRALSGGGRPNLRGQVLRADDQLLCDGLNRRVLARHTMVGADHPGLVVGTRVQGRDPGQRGGGARCRLRCRSGRGGTPALGDVRHRGTCLLGLSPGRLVVGVVELSVVAVGVLEQSEVDAHLPHRAAHESSSSTPVPAPDRAICS